MSRLIRSVLILIILSSVIPSCGKLTDSDREPQFKIVSVYEGMDEYVEDARANPEADLDDLFQKHVIDPYWKECAEGGEYLYLAEGYFKDPIEDLDGLEEEIDFLRNSGIEDVIEEALKQASALLDGPDTTVCIAALDPENTSVLEHMNGVTGRTAGSGKILAQVSIQEGWQDLVSYLVAHEYHHSVWTSRHYEGNEGSALLNYLVFEGRADTFAHLVYPDVEVPWRNALSPEQEAEQWRKMKSQLTITDFGMQQRYMFGDGRSVPFWSGYTIGFHIVQAYLLKNPETTLDEWTGMDAREILEQSSYSGGH